MGYIIGIYDLKILVCDIGNVFFKIMFQDVVEDESISELSIVEQ